MRTCLKDPLKQSFYNKRKEKNKGNACLRRFARPQDYYSNALYNNTIHHLHIFLVFNYLLFLVFVLFLCFFSSFSLEDLSFYFSFPFCVLPFRLQTPLLLCFHSTYLPRLLLLSQWINSHQIHQT